ncbi:hypothetical protein [Celeribacter marinus]|uniref:Uncharacterized protein n=1 Tax=Celeribacter marinus TaxID=1397108 RepID=A0A0P0A863_9RHOB|nr:hypothetical protein [Celeribacter marinus]ALI54612.1 hypothetical protein IMCC12053_664 [Celeribacter marinus]SFK50978.1 hypothetical protein SAMN05444421_10536 [Celeribacter marinus]
MTLQSANMTRNGLNESAMSLSTLHARLQDEMLALTMLAAEVQIALGATLKNVQNLSPSVQRSMQAVDRLQQTLEDLQGVMAQLARQNTGSTVDISPLKESIRLRHLAHKLFDDIDAPFTLSEEDSGNVAWF